MFNVNESPFLGAGLEWAYGLNRSIIENIEKLSFIELIPENFFDGKNKSFIEAAQKANIPVAVHAVELSLGTIQPIKEDHFKKVREIIDSLNTVNFSEHLSMTEAGGIDIGALTPLHWTEKVLDRVCRNIEYIQKYIDVPMSVENVSNRFMIPDADYSEAAFINKVLERTDTTLLLDLNNVYANSLNFHFDPFEWIEEINLDKVNLIHLAGGYYDREGFFRDSHDTAILEPVWDLFRHVCEKIRPPMTVVERTGNYPAIEELLAEVERANAVLSETAYLHEQTSLPAGASATI